MIQWFPGHMAKTRKEIQENLKLVDIVFELLDARIPISSKNPLIDNLINQKPRLVILTKADLADERKTKLFIDYYLNRDILALAVDAISGTNLNKITRYTKEVLSEKLAREKAKGLKERPIRVMIVGVPNVGKSTLINRLVKKRVAKVGDKPGITRARQWIRIGKDLELLDMPGVLWPKFEDEKIGIHLALTGAIKDEILDNEKLGNYLLDYLRLNYEKELLARYDIDLDKQNLDVFNEIANLNGYFGDDRTSRAIDKLIFDFRNTRLGKITLDELEDGGA